MKKNIRQNEKLYLDSSSFSIWLIMTLIVLLIFPIMWVIYASFASFQGFDTLNQKIVEIGSLKIDNYGRLLQKYSFTLHLWNTLVTSSIAIIINVMTASMGAFILKFLNVKLRKTLVFIAVSGVVIQFQLIAPNISPVIEYFYLKNTVFGIALLYASLCLPFSFYVFSKYFEKTPKELTEAAIMDGMPMFSRYYRIELPYAKPAVVISSAFCLFYSWNDFLIAEFILTDSGKYTLNQAIRHVMPLSGMGLVELFSLCSIAAVFAFFIYYYIGKNTIFNEINRS